MSLVSLPCGYLFHSSYDDEFGQQHVCANLKTRFPQGCLLERAACCINVHRILHPIMYASCAGRRRLRRPPEHLQVILRRSPCWHLPGRSLLPSWLTLHHHAQQQQWTGRPGPGFTWIPRCSSHIRTLTGHGCVLFLHMHLRNILVLNPFEARQEMVYHSRDCTGSYSLHMILILVTLDYIAYN